MSARTTPAPLTSGPVGKTLWGKISALEDGRPVLIVNDSEGRIVAKVYISPDERVFRIVMPELSEASQVKIDEEHHLVDIQRHQGG